MVIIGVGYRVIARGHSGPDRGQVAGRQQSIFSLISAVIIIFQTIQRRRTDSPAAVVIPISPRPRGDLAVGVVKDIPFSRGRVIVGSDHSPQTLVFCHQPVPFCLAGGSFPGVGIGDHLVDDLLAAHTFLSSRAAIPPVVWVKSSTVCYILNGVTQIPEQFGHPVHLVSHSGGAVPGNIIQNLAQVPSGRLNALLDILPGVHPVVVLLFSQLFPLFGGFFLRLKGIKLLAVLLLQGLIVVLPGFFLLLLLVNQILDVVLPGLALLLIGGYLLADGVDLLVNKVLLLVQQLLLLLQGPDLFLQPLDNLLVGLFLLVVLKLLLRLLLGLLRIGQGLFGFRYGLLV